MEGHYCTIEDLSAVIITVAQLRVPNPNSLAPEQESNW